MAKKGIPESIRRQVDEIVNRFNQEVIQDPDYFYVTRYRGIYAYFDRRDWDVVIHVFRLKYTGDMSGWEFAIYKYSSERYDPEEWMFPGSGLLDGTIEGALRAGLEAYP